MEEWKDIIGYEGKYKISNFGNVYSYKSKKNLKPQANTDRGYLLVGLYTKGKSTANLVLISRLVAIHFLSNPDNLPIVHHKDNNNQNNNILNLQWVTYSQNTQYAWNDGRISKKHYKTKNQANRKIHKTIPEYYNDLNSVLQNEIWVDIKNYEGLYQVSNYGRVKLIKETQEIRKERIKKIKSHNGYLWVGLSKRGYTTYSLHRLVALNFIPNPENKPFVNHKDGNKLNNCVDNLEWVTPLENTKHAIELGLLDSRGENSYCSTLKNEDIFFIRSSDLHNNDLAESFKVSSQTIRRIKSRQTWAHI